MLPKEIYNLVGKDIKIFPRDEFVLEEILYDEIGEKTAINLIKMSSTGEILLCKTFNDVAVCKYDAETLFKRELMFASFLSGNKGFVKLHGVCLKPKLSIIMEYVDGADLHDWVPEEKDHIPEDDVKPMLMDLLKTVKFLHDRGISHGDIKPENFLMNGEDEIKLIDFETSRFVNSEKPEIIYSTTEYVSPENIDNKISSIKGDIWACGITIYELLTGDVPFGERSDTNFKENVKNIRIVNDSKVLSKEAREMIMMALKYENERCDIDDLINHEFFSQG